MTVERLEQDYRAAVEHAQTLRSRNVDPGTLSDAVAKAQDLKARLAGAQAHANQTAESERLTEGMTSASMPPGAALSFGAQFVASKHVQVGSSSTATGSRPVRDSRHD